MKTIDINSLFTEENMIKYFIKKYTKLLALAPSNTVWDMKEQRRLIKKLVKYRKELRQLNN